jgi:hypothetical protein
MSRLKAIVDARGGLLLEGGRRALIRGPGYGKTDRSVSLIETEDGRILIHCFSPRDDWRTVRDDLATAGLLGEPVGQAASRLPVPKSPVVQPHTEDKTKRALRIWGESRPIENTPAERYLRARAIPRMLPGALRFHAAMTSLEDRDRRGALIGAITDGAGEITGVHVTLLSAHGATKAQLATPRRVVGRMMGAAVRLDDPDESLIVAEGIETALSAQAALQMPTWALMSAVNLARFELPPSLARLIIAADNDDAGLEAAHLLQARIREDISCELALPPDGSNDWNEWLQHRRT